ncbi:MAG: APC family permease, partial [Burkholderiales bacterium]
MEARTTARFAEPLTWHPERPRIRPARLVVAWLIAALALLAATYIVPGAEVEGFWGALLVALVVAVLNATLPPFIAALRLPFTLALGFLLVLAGIVFRGIRESMWVNVLCTLVEASGLILVVAVGLSYWGSVDLLEMPPAAVDQGEWLILMQGAVLTFFAFIGFEDTLNVAEECRDPQRTIPLGLILAMSMAAVLYIAIAVTAVSVVPWAELASAPGPITEVVRRAAPLIPPIVF